MALSSQGWSIEFRGCADPEDDCSSAVFDVTSPVGERQKVEIRTTTQIEAILAREKGKTSLARADRESLLASAGRKMIEESIARGRIDQVLTLDSRIFRSAGEERRLLDAM